MPRDRIARTLRHDEVPWVRAADLKDRYLPRPVVLVNGAFDVLHSGHMKVLFHARRQGRTVVVAMDSDARVAKSKVGRPIQTWVERATTMNYMPVDYVVEIGSQRDMTNLIRAIQPNLRVQGGDHSSAPSHYPDVPKMFVRGTGMRTSKIVARIEAAYAKRSV